MAKDVEIKVKLNVDGTGIKSINDLKDSIKALEAESDKLDLGSEAFENAKEKIASFKQELTNLSKSRSQINKEMVDNAKKAEKEISDATEKETKAREEKYLKLGDNVQKLAAGITDAFAGAFIAFGAGEKDAEEFNKTLQQGVGIAVGVKGAIEGVIAAVQLAGPAIEAFNAIIAANPIGAVVVAVAALTAGIYLLVKAINAEKDESEKLTESFNKQKAAAEALSKARQSEISVMEARIELMKAQGKSDAEILKATTALYEIKKKALQQDLVQLELQANITKAKLVEVLANESLTESYFKVAAASARLVGDEKQAMILDAAAAAEKKKNSKEVTDQLLKDLTAIKELKDKIAVLEIQKDTEVATVITKNAETKKKAAEKSAEELQKIYEAEAEAFWQAQLKEQAENKALDEKTKAERIQAAKDTALALEIIAKHSIESRLNTLKVNYDLDVQAAGDNKAKLLLLEAKYQEDKEKIIKEGVDAQKKINDDAAKASEEAAKLLGEKITKVANAIGSTASIMGGAILGIFQAINDLQKQQAEEDTANRQEKLDADLSNLEAAKESELQKEGLTAEKKADIEQAYAMAKYQLELQEYKQNTEIKRKAFEQDKKLKIAQTVINTITGAVAALTGMISAIPGPVGIVLGAVAAAAVVAMGAINVAAIQKQKFDAGTPPAEPKMKPPTSNAGPAASGLEAMEGPKLNKIGRTQEQIQQDAEAGSNKRTASTSSEPVRAYVVSSDITTAQDKNAVIERRASF